MNSNNKQFLVNQLMWVGMSFGISLMISLVVPFPISIIVILGAFLLLNSYLRKRMAARIGGSGGDAVGVRNGVKSGMFDLAPSREGLVKYYCLSCGTKHKEDACPKCGSKIKRAGFIANEVTTTDDIVRHLKESAGSR